MWIYYYKYVLHINFSTLVGCRKTTNRHFNPLKISFVLYVNLKNLWIKISLIFHYSSTNEYKIHLNNWIYNIQFASDVFVIAYERQIIKFNKDQCKWSKGQMNLVKLTFESYNHSLYTIYGFHYFRFTSWQV